MARRKSTKKPAPKKRIPKLDTEFTCPFCNHQKSVECIFVKLLKIGTISCRICNESFTTEINVLTEAIDIYSEWIDACEAANVRPNPNPNREEGSRPRRHRVAGF